MPLAVVIGLVKVVQFDLGHIGPGNEDFDPRVLHKQFDEALGAEPKFRTMKS